MAHWSRRSAGRRTTTASVLLATALLATVGGGAPATAQSTAQTTAQTTGQTTAQGYWVPANHLMTVTGLGFGHGHGMSQYGAEGAARQGLTAAQILAFYYPGTATGQFTGPIRVRIDRDDDNVLTVGAASGLTAHDLGSGRSYALPAKMGSATVKAWRMLLSGGRTVVGYETGGWHRYTPAVLTGDGEFSATGPITLQTSSGSTAYRGTLRLATPTGSAAGTTTRDVVNVVGMDDYVRGVVSREMPTSWQPAAVQAQAVAARTYAANSIGSASSHDWQICDTASCQVYGGVAAEDARANAAVAHTAGQILTYRGAPAFTQFSASDGGWTSAGSVPYLVARADPYDGYSGNPVHSWTTTIDTRVLERRYPALGALERIRVTQRDGHGAWAGRAWTVVLDGSRKDVTISGDTLRAIYGLRSSWYSFASTPIIARWRALGATRSPLGAPKAREVARPGGAVQVFSKGRMYGRTKVLPYELDGPVLTAYLARGGVYSKLGWPTTAVRTEPGGTGALFQHGEIHATAAGVRVVYR